MMPLKLTVVPVWIWELCVLDITVYGEKYIKGWCWSLNSTSVISKSTRLVSNTPSPSILGYWENCQHTLASVPLLIRDEMCQQMDGDFK